MASWNAVRGELLSPGTLADITTSEKLCQECNSLDIDKILNSHKDVDRMGKSDGIFESERIVAKDCPLCDFFVPGARIINSLQRIDSTISFTEHSDSLDDPKVVDFTLTKLLVGLGYSGLDHIEVSQGERTSFVYKLPRQYARPLERFEAFSWLKAMISECTGNIEPEGSFPGLEYQDDGSQHEVCCREVPKRPPHGYRVIDCITNEIVSPPKDAQYLALSYVWGGYHPKTRYLADAPQVIKDSMYVTQKLGFRYIWVDQYCIDQENPEEVFQQVQQMNHIYTSATATIIDAAGKSSKTGLPGISTSRVNNQREIRFKGVDLVHTPNRDREWQDIEASPWNSRGWTFQEGLFSPRRIFFCENEVFFDCKAYNCRETGFTVMWSWCPPYAPGPRVWGSPNKDGVCDSDFENLIVSYYHRNLTNGNDILNAFEGAFTAFREMSEPVYNIWGIPVDMDEEFTSPAFFKYLDFSWESTPKRRTGFPSWSWAGWEGGGNINFTRYLARHNPNKSLKIDASSDHLTEALQGSQAYSSIMFELADTPGTLVSTTEVKTRLTQDAGPQSFTKYISLRGFSRIGLCKTSRENVMSSLEDEVNLVMPVTFELENGTCIRLGASIHDLGILHPLIEDIEASDQDPGQKEFSFPVNVVWMLDPDPTEIHLFAYLIREVQPGVWERCGHVDEDQHYKYDIHKGLPKASHALDLMRAFEAELKTFCLG
jgi:hypothetical protein